MKKLFVLACAIMALSAPLFALWEKVSDPIKYSPIFGATDYPSLIFKYGDYIFLSAPYNGLKRSIDNGQHWSKCLEIDKVTSNSQGFNSLFITDSMNNLYISKDSGVTWKLNGTIPHETGYDFARLIGGNSEAVFVERSLSSNPNDPIHLFASYDTGKTWDKIGDTGILPSSTKIINNTTLTTCWKYGNIDSIGISKDNGRTWINYQNIGIAISILDDISFHVYVKPMTNKRIIARRINFGEAYDSICPADSILFGGIYYQFQSFDFPRVTYRQIDFRNGIFNILEGLTLDTGKSFTIWNLTNLPRNGGSFVVRVKNSDVYYSFSDQFRQLFFWNFNQGIWSNVSADLEYMLYPWDKTISGVKIKFAEIYPGMTYAFNNNGTVFSITEDYFGLPVPNIYSLSSVIERQDFQYITESATYIFLDSVTRKTSDSGNTWKSCPDLGWPFIKYGTSLYKNGPDGIFKRANDSTGSWVFTQGNRIKIRHFISYCQR